MLRALAAVGVIPFLPLAPPKQPLAGVPDCRAGQLHASVSLQGATGSMLGAFGLRNFGRSCVLRTPLRPVLVEDGKRLPFVRVGGADTRLGFHALLLRPGRTGAVELQLFNDCGRHARARLFILVPRGRGLVPLGIGAEGRCDVPSKPPGWDEGALDRGDPPALSKVAQAQHAGLRIRSVQLPQAVHAGRTLRYTLTIVARRSVPARTCPLVYEQLWLWKQGRVITRQYLLNCAPVGAAFAPGQSYVFALALPVPRSARGSASIQVGLEDDVAPLPPTSSLKELLSSAVAPDAYTESYRGNFVRLLP